MDRPAPSRFRRVVGETSTKVGLTTAAALAVLIVISAFLLVRGYNQNLPPSGSSSVTSVNQLWPSTQPIKIEFNKPMNQDSVLENLQILPPGERDRILKSVRWDHNTLILGSGASPSTLFLPDTSYQVVVLAGARDTYGQPLADPVTFSFHTSSIADAARTPTPTPTGSAVSTATPGQSQQSANVPPAQTNLTPATTATRQSTTTSTSPSVTATATKVTTPSPTLTQPTATPTNSGNTSGTPTPSPTAAPTQNATPAGTPSGTPSTAGTPEATPNATPSPTEQAAAATPVASATPSADTATTTVIPVTGAFGSVFWANSDVQSKLGDPQAPEAHLNAAELGFQNGTMYERFDTSQIYVLFADSQWNSVPDTWTAAEGEGGGVSPDDPQLWVPKGSFGKVWNSDPLLEKSIGYAVSADAHVMGGVVQQFANGIMLYSDQGFVYVLYNDSSWALYPDTSGHGDLITPTPSAGETPVSTPAETPTPDATNAAMPQPTTP